MGEGSSVDDGDGFSSAMHVTLNSAEIKWRSGYWLNRDTC